MNQVCNFLSLLAVTEEQGGVKRMLGVCQEFERIARVVLERGDKKGHKRRGSKMNAENPNSNVQTSDPTQQRQAQAQTQARHGQKRAGPPLSPESNNAPTPQNVFSPSAFNDLTNGQSFNPSMSGFSPSLSNMNLPLDFGNSPGGTADFQNMMASSPNGMSGANFDPTQYSPEGLPADGLNLGAFQQPFVPQDLWQMPMTLEWDWSAAMQGPAGLDANAMDMGLAPGQSQEGQQQMEGGDGYDRDQMGMNGGGGVMM